LGGAEIISDRVSTAPSAILDIVGYIGVTVRTNFPFGLSRARDPHLRPINFVIKQLFFVPEGYTVFLKISAFLFFKFGAMNG
jgi:hypothetical protein